MRNMLKTINYRHLFTDLLIVIASPIISLLLRTSLDESSQFIPDLIKIFPVIIACRIIAFLYFETHIIIWRYVSAFDAIKLAKAVLSSSMAIIAITYLFRIGYIPRSVYFIDAILLVFLMSGARLTRRMLYEYENAKIIKNSGQKTLIYGAGTTGQGILKRLLNDKELNFFVVGFIDDDKLKIGKSISGFKVLGTGENLISIINDLKINQLVIGIPHASPEFLKRIVSICTPLGIRPLMMAGDNSSQTNLLREIELKDLLIREPRKIDIESTKKMIKDKRVLITGAGGSIGSEISRQVFSFSPSRLVILDHSEFNLYNIDKELKSYPNSENVISCLSDVKDLNSLESVFREFRPEIVLHAAAYKHVHLVESNPFTSILNNILGTKNLLDLSEKYDVDNYVQISTDKAVNPAGIMGATKRICEIMTSMKGFKTKKNFCAVRFGNVLGSSGSLIPLLKKQISNGETVTITHKDMTRYFMLIEEAVALVLKAASIAKPGDINVLKMGEPIKIIDIAKNLITLMGKNENEVNIKFTGLRPGEKMFEELYISGKELNTEHPDILVVPEGDSIPESLRTPLFDNQIDQMIKFAKSSDRESIILLNTIVASKYNLTQTQSSIFQLIKTKSVEQ